jgi:hypothetical protein
VADFLRGGLDFLVAVRVVLRLVLRVVVLRERAVFRATMDILHTVEAENGRGAERFLCRSAGNSSLPKALTGMSGIGRCHTALEWRIPGRFIIGSTRWICS